MRLHSASHSSMLCDVMITVCPVIQHVQNIKNLNLCAALRQMRLKQWPYWPATKGASSPKGGADTLMITPSILFPLLMNAIDVQNFA